MYPAAGYRTSIAIAIATCTVPGNKSVELKKSVPATRTPLRLRLPTPPAMFTTSHSLCTNCQGHIHGPDHAVGTNLCCLAGFSPDPIRDIPPHQTFSPSKQMLAVSANGSILRGARSMHVPY